MDRKHRRSQSTGCTPDTHSSKTDTYCTTSQSNTSDLSGKSCYRSSSQSNRSDYTTYSDCDRSSRDCDKTYDNSCENDSKSYKNSCSYDCGLKYSNTPVGVWNMLYSCEEACTTTGTLEWINQFLLNADETVTSFSIPDVSKNPFPSILSTGLGVWKSSDRKIRLELTHIGYRSSDGSPQTYYRIYIVMKLNTKRTKARFRGEACAFDITDPTMCTPADVAPVCFEGHAVKVLEPGCDN